MCLPLNELGIVWPETFALGNYLQSRKMGLGGDFLPILPMQLILGYLKTLGNSHNEYREKLGYKSDLHRQITYFSQSRTRASVSLFVYPGQRFITQTLFQLRRASRKKRAVVARDIPALKPYLRESCDVLQRLFRDKKRAFLEGTHGTGLSVFHGYYPHVTSRDTTVTGCLAEAGISPTRVRKVVMVCRSYPIRVGSPSSDFTSAVAARGQGIFAFNNRVGTEIQARFVLPLRIPTQVGQDSDVRPDSVPMQAGHRSD